MSIEKDLRAIKTQVNREGGKFNDFLLENAFATISTAIEPGVRLYQIDLASPGLKAQMLRYSKFALTYPDGSNPTVIELKVGILPAGSTTIYLYVSGQDLWEQDIFPAFGYPVGSLISGLDYEANSILAAAGGDGTSGGDVQYYWGGFLTGSDDPAPQGSPYDFKFNPASGVVTAEGFSGDGSALTNLPTSDPAGSNTDVQFNDNGSLAGSSNLTYDKNTGEFNAPRILGENISGSVYQDSAGYSAMYLTPDDFIATNNGYQQGIISNDGGRMGWSSISYNHYATFQVPKGYKVTSVDLKGSANYNFFVYASSWSSQYGIYKATGTMNTQLSLLSYQQLIGNSGDYFMIKFRPSGYGNYIYGCKILLYPT